MVNTIQWEAIRRACFSMAKELLFLAAFLVGAFAVWYGALSLADMYSRKTGYSVFHAVNVTVRWGYDLVGAGLVFHGLSLRTNRVRMTRQIVYGSILLYIQTLFVFA